MSTKFDACYFLSKVLSRWHYD